MPRNMAVEEPRARVVGPETKDQPPLGGEHGGVAAGGVPEAEGVGVGCGVEVAHGCRERGGYGGRASHDEEVVALDVLSLGSNPQYVGMG